VLLRKPLERAQRLVLLVWLVLHNVIQPPQLVRRNLQPPRLVLRNLQPPRLVLRHHTEQVQLLSQQVRVRPNK
jgi:hypothetical protein